MYVAYGQPEDELLKLINDILVKKKDDTPVIDVVVASKEITSEENEIEEKLKLLLKDKNIRLNLLWDMSMIHLDDLPYDNISKLPDVFTIFRKQAEIKGESNYKVRKPAMLSPSYSLPTLKFEDSFNWGVEKMPNKAEFKESPNSAIFGFRGGESQAMERTMSYFFNSDGLENYKTTRNGLIGKEYSSKLSMWLAIGCVSARYLYWKVKEYEEKNRANESTKAFAFELLWRDFFKFQSKKYGKFIFFLNGCHSTANKRPNSASSLVDDKKWKTDKDLFEKWCNGQTGTFIFLKFNLYDFCPKT